MKQLNLLRAKRKNLKKPKKSTIDFILAYSKNLGAIHTKLGNFTYSKN